MPEKRRACHNLWRAYIQDFIQSFFTFKMIEKEKKIWHSRIPIIFLSRERANKLFLFYFIFAQCLPKKKKKKKNAWEVNFLVDFGLPTVAYLYNNRILHSANALHAG